MPHSINARVYYEDTDAGGVVFYANYLKFAERGRTELLRFMGFENTSLREKYGVIFVVRHAEADYIKPARLDDLLKIETAISEVKNASAVMTQSVFLNNEKICAMKIVLVCVDGDKAKATAFPEEVKRSFERYMKDHI